MARVALVVWSVLLLSGCASMGRSPGQTDAACVRQQMAPPVNWVFDMAASRCVRYTNDGTFAQMTSRRIPLDLRGAPDLQAQAAAVGYPFTE